jgi:hypothetical protein
MPKEVQQLQSLTVRWTTASSEGVRHKQRHWEAALSRRQVLLPHQQLPLPAQRSDSRRAACQQRLRPHPNAPREEAHPRKFRSSPSQHVLIVSVVSRFSSQNQTDAVASSCASAATFGRNVPLLLFSLSVDACTQSGSSHRRRSSRWGHDTPLGGSHSLRLPASSHAAFFRTHPFPFTRHHWHARTKQQQH